MVTRKKYRKNYNNKKVQVNGGAKKYRIKHNNKKMQVNGGAKKYRKIIIIKRCK